MKITIDTNVDSPEDIKQLIQLLQQKIGSKEPAENNQKYQDFFASPEVQSESQRENVEQTDHPSSFAAMFNNPASPPEPTIEMKTDLPVAKQDKFDDEKIPQDILDQVQIYDE